MSWITIKTKNGVWKLKPRWQMRWAEQVRRVRVIDLGVIVLSWWSDEDVQNL